VPGRSSARVQRIADLTQSLPGFALGPVWSTTSAGRVGEAGSCSAAHYSHVRRRLSAFYEFALSQLPPPPVRVLEVGCGGGEVAFALAEAGYSVTAIDPEAPEGPIFRRVALEDFESDGVFDAVVASVSLHHVHDLGAAFDQIAALLRPGGVLVLEEFAKERLRGATAEWYYDERRRRDATLPHDFETWLHEWDERHRIHTWGELRRALDGRFEERYFARGPYLYDFRLDDALERVERALIEAGAIDATGVRYVGKRPGA
jgi:SAM-dependent methyltransferase